MAEQFATWSASIGTSDAVTNGAHKELSMTLTGNPIPSSATLIYGMITLRVKHTGNVFPQTNDIHYLGIKEKTQAFLGTYGSTSSTAISCGITPFSSINDLGSSVVFGNDPVSGAPSDFPISNLEIFKGVGNFTLRFSHTISPELFLLYNSVDIVIAYTDGSEGDNTDMAEKITKIEVNGVVYSIGVDLESSSGLLPVSSGGTGATTASAARKNLGITGLSAVQTAAPTDTTYALWVDTTEETDSSIMPADAVKFKSFSIATSAWSGSGPYTYQMTANGITADSAILTIQVNSASLGYLKTPLDWETGANYIKLSTITKPTGTITGYCIGVKVVQI